MSKVWKGVKKVGKAIGGAVKSVVKGVKKVFKKVWDSTLGKVAITAGAIWLGGWALGAWGPGTGGAAAGASSGAATSNAAQLAAGGDAATIAGNAAGAGSAASSAVPAAAATAPALPAAGAATTGAQAAGAAAAAVPASNTAAGIVGTIRALGSGAARAASTVGQWAQNNQLLAAMAVQGLGNALTPSPEEERRDWLEDERRRMDANLNVGDIDVGITPTNQPARRLSTGQPVWQPGGGIVSSLRSRPRFGT